MKVGVLAAIGLLAVLAIAACGDDDSGNGATSTPTNAASAGLPRGSERVELDPADFVAEIDNPYWPMKPGNKWTYNETDTEGNEMLVEVTVTSDQKTIIGITATVVHDIVTEDGATVEDTVDWYAQDSAGNIWYLGEDTKEYEDGVVVSTEGSWEAGVDDAQPGIVVPANPAVGMAYRQEYLAGEAEDEAKVLSIDEHVEVPFGTFDGCIQTEDTTALEPDVLEHKFYCKDVGPALVNDVAAGGGEELVSFEQGG